jgi:hypothetical protein
VNVGVKTVRAAAHIFQVGWSQLAVVLIVVVALAFVVAGCSSSASGGNLHLRITQAFDNRSTEADLWNSGTITADGSFPASRLDTMEIGLTYDGNDLGAGRWSATTEQQLGDFEGECNGSEDCHPCTATYGGSWPIPSVDFTVQERGNDRHVIELWLGSDTPPKTGGCDPIANSPYIWAAHLTVLLTGIGSATPTATVTASGTGSSTPTSGAGGYAVEVTQ